MLDSFDGVADVTRQLNVNDRDAVYVNTWWTGGHMGWKAPIQSVQIVRLPLCG